MKKEKYGFGVMHRILIRDIISGKKIVFVSQNKCYN